MTFEEWRRTREGHADLGKEVDDMDGRKGFTYGDKRGGFAWIEELPEGGYYTIVFNDEFMNGDLAAVERFLWTNFVEGSF